MRDEFRAARAGLVHAVSVDAGAESLWRSAGFTPRRLLLRQCHLGVDAPCGLPPEAGAPRHGPGAQAFTGHPRTFDAPDGESRRGCLVSLSGTCARQTPAATWCSWLTIQTSLCERFMPSLRAELAAVSPARGMGIVAMAGSQRFWLTTVYLQRCRADLIGRRCVSRLFSSRHSAPIVPCLRNDAGRLRRRSGTPRWSAACLGAPSAMKGRNERMNGVEAGGGTDSSFRALDHPRILAGQTSFCYCLEGGVETLDFVPVSS